MKFAMTFIGLLFTNMVFAAGADRTLTDVNKIIFKESGGSNRMTMQLPGLSSDFTLTLPDSVSANKCLLTDGSGTLSFSTLGVTGGGTGTGTALTEGSVVFAGSGGTYTQDNSNLFWDNTAKALGIGTATPGYALQVKKSVAGTPTTIEVSNLDNTNGASHAHIQMSAGGSGGTSSGGDPQLIWSVNTVRTYSMGIDNSVSGDPLVISANANLGTNDLMSLNSGGSLTLNAYGAGLLHSSSGGAITSSAVSLTADVSGTLPIANGGTNNGSLAVTAGGALYTDGSKIMNTGAGTSGRPLVSGGSSAPSFAVLGIAGGGTNNASLIVTTGSLVYTDGSGLAATGVGAAYSVMVANGTGAAPSWASYLSIASGGTNNASLGVTNGGVIYTDGSKLMNSGAGTSGQVLQSAGAGAPTWLTVGGTWTPTVSNGTNMAASTARQGTWMRAKDTVHVCFAPDLDPTATGAADFYFTLPVASNFTSDLVDATGVCDWNGGTTNGVCHCNADSTGDRMYCSLNAASTANATAWVCAQYIVK